MHLADADIAEFQMLYKKHFGIEISKAEALEKGLRLIRLLEIVSKAVAKKQGVKNASAENPRRVP